MKIQENKKILVLAGGALVVGAIGYFIFSYFKKTEIPIGNTTISLKDEDDTPSTSPTETSGGGFDRNYFSNMLIKETKLPDLKLNTGISYSLN